MSFGVTLAIFRLKQTTLTTSSVVQGTWRYRSAAGSATGKEVWVPLSMPSQDRFRDDGGSVWVHHPRWRGRVGRRTGGKFTLSFKFIACNPSLRKVIARLLLSNFKEKWAYLYPTIFCLYRQVLRWLNGVAGGLLKFIYCVCFTSQNITYTRWFPSSSWSCQCLCGCCTVVKRYITKQLWSAADIFAGVKGKALLCSSTCQAVFRQ